VPSDSSAPSASSSVRIDLWLWSVRCFKTRSQAAAACHKGTVSVRGIKAKPAREVGPGDIVGLRQPFVTRQLRVKAVLRQRVGAKLVADYYEDVTPPEELALARELEASVRAAPQRESGAGRPTKRDRRELERWSESDSPGPEDPVN